MSGPVAPTERRAWVEQIMGMPISLHLRQGADDPASEVAVAAAYGLLRQVDQRFSTYRADSEISQLNRGRLRLADAHPEVREIVRWCAVARRRTGGYFDARLPVGVLPPGMSLVNAALGRGPSGDGRWFDPSGLVKGWAVQRAAELLTARGVVDFCLNAGGDIAMRCAPGQAPWRVGVEDPADPSRLLAVLDVTDGAVATSGTGRRGAHINDPHTGRPAVTFSSVTVTGPDLTWADIYATAVAASGRRPSDLPAGYHCPVVTNRSALR